MFGLVLSVLTLIPLESGLYHYDNIPRRSLKSNIKVWHNVWVLLWISSPQTVEITCMGKAKL